MQPRLGEVQLFRVTGVLDYSPSVGRDCVLFHLTHIYRAPQRVRHGARNRTQHLPWAARISLGKQIREHINANSVKSARTCHIYVM